MWQLNIYSSYNIKNHDHTLVNVVKATQNSDVIVPPISYTDLIPSELIRKRFYCGHVNVQSICGKDMAQFSELKLLLSNLNMF